MDIISRGSYPHDRAKMGEEPPLKKPKTDGQAIPEYGSKQYWEQRYANKTEERPEHSWYFTYDELRPILMSVLLGRPTEAEESSDEDDYEEEQIPGLATDGPIKVLEIGCGDVPLGEQVAKDVPVQEILCTDYSETVIQKLLQLNIPLLTFRTMDARNMDLPDESYQLILDKGTLDAMLSDTELGIENCVSIVSECARVLTAPGCMMIVSHLNAHTTNGIRWLNEVVFPGLGSVEAKTAKFHIEVHGSDAPNESSTENGADSSAGPAVYIIHKHATDPTDPVDDDDDEDPVDSETVTTIPVQFFTYS